MITRLDAVDWTSLFHAEGPATDTPERLRAMLGREDEMDAEAFVDGYSHLWQTLHPGGKAWPVTTPSALVATELLDDPRLGPDDPSLPRALLAYLQSFATAADLGGDEGAVRARVEQRTPEIEAWTKEFLAADRDDRERMWADGSGVGELVLDRARLACLDVVPAVLEKVLPHLALGDVRHRVSAAEAVGALARHPSAAGLRPGLVRRLESLADEVEAAHDLAAVVIAIGQLGGDTQSWLEDARPCVRGCAALAPTLAEDALAAEVLVRLARAPRAFAASLGDIMPHHFHVRPWRDHLSEAVVARVRDPRRLAPALIARLPLGAKSSYKTLTSYLRALFSDETADEAADIAVDARLSALQRRLAEIIAGWDALWRLDDAARAAVFGPARLSTEREVWLKWAAQPDDDPYSPATLFVFEGFSAVRSRPEMFFGVGRAHPELPDGVISVLRGQFEHAVSTGAIGSFKLDVEAADSGRRFTVDVRGHALPATSEGLDGVFARLHTGWPFEYLSIAAALCSRIEVRAWSGDTCVTSEYVDGMALGPLCTVPVDEVRDGYAVTFEMDDDWRPSGGTAS